VIPESLSKTVSAWRPESHPDPWRTKAILVVEEGTAPIKVITGVEKTSMLLMEMEEIESLVGEGGTTVTKTLNREKKFKKEGEGEGKKIIGKETIQNSKFKIIKNNPARTCKFQSPERPVLV